MKIRVDTTWMLEFENSERASIAYSDDDDTATVYVSDDYGKTELNMSAPHMREFAAALIAAADKVEGK